MLKKSLRVMVIGVGGAGCNAISRMIHDQIPGVEYVAVNTDRKDLEGCLSTEKLVIGSKIVRGRTTGGNVDLGKRAAQESLKEIEDIISDTDILFITAGLGGGTGTGATPVIAELARKKGIYTVGVFTLPFSFEGESRVERAAEGIQVLKKKVDTLMVIANDKLNSVVEEDATFNDAMNMANDVLSNVVKRVSSIAFSNGEEPLDINEVRQAIAQGESALGSIYQHIHDGC
ncbi:MAG: cell division FtsZ family protein [Candidatus Sabulitectum sp.]|nr:cell division FtsZ family protein [Candidatus Sabulitectum sp.]